MSGLIAVEAMILDLKRHGAPGCLMLCLLLLSFNEKIPRGPHLDFVEVWAGKAEVTKALRAIGFRGVAFDILHNELYDVCTVTGFLTLLQLSHGFIKLTQVKTVNHRCVDI